jgi:hypothetical protein
MALRGLPFDRRRIRGVVGLGEFRSEPRQCLTTCDDSPAQAGIIEAHATNAFAAPSPQGRNVEPPST